MLIVLKEIFKIKRELYLLKDYNIYYSGGIIECIEHIHSLNQNLIDELNKEYSRWNEIFLDIKEYCLKIWEKDTIEKYLIQDEVHLSLNSDIFYRKGYIELHKKVKTFLLDCKKRMNYCLIIEALLREIDKEYSNLI